MNIFELTIPPIWDKNKDADIDNEEVPYILCLDGGAKEIQQDTEPAGPVVGNGVYVSIPIDSLNDVKEDEISTFEKKVANHEPSLPEELTIDSDSVGPHKDSGKCKEPPLQLKGTKCEDLLYNVQPPIFDESIIHQEADIQSHHPVSDNAELTSSVQTITNTESIGCCPASIAINRLDDVRPGCALLFSRFLYDHWAIVLNVNKTYITLIEYKAGCFLFNVRIRKSTKKINKIVKGNRVKKLVIEPAGNLTFKDVVNRTKGKVGEGGYNPFTHNCHHMVWYCFGHRKDF